MNTPKPAGSGPDPASGDVHYVVLDTAAGEIVVAVDAARAPLSAGDFLNYVDLGLFDGGEFHRTVRPDNELNPVRIDVIQAAPTTKLSGIRHEPTNLTGLRHVDGAISLGRYEPGTGSAGYLFICIGDQPDLDFGGRRNPDGQGFAAFGRVVRGMPVVRAIWRMRLAGPPVSPVGERLEQPVRIHSARRTGPVSAV